MNDLASRLRELVGGPSAVLHVPRPARDPDRNERVGRALGGDWNGQAHGLFVSVERSYGPAACHGSQTIGQWLAQADTPAASLGLVLGRCSPPADDLDESPPHAARTLGSADARLLFVDLETTGLAGGAGTVAFLVGFGWFEQGSFRTRQLLLPDFSAERSLLGAAATTVEPAAAIVSFNGKSFDLPVLETRYLLQRLEVPFTSTIHFDVLHPARRLWRSREGCALADLERDLLGVERQDDVPGFEIPARYFEFVRSGDPSLLTPILEHNRLDLISLAGLAMRIAHLVERGPEAGRDAGECLGLGRLYERAGERRRAAGSYERSVRLARPGEREIRVEALRRLARLRRRERRQLDAAELWQAVLCEVDGPSAVEREALQALAIHHEHRSRDLARARRYAQQMSGRLGQGMVSAVAVRHRLERLDRKLARSGFLV